MFTLLFCIWLFVSCANITMCCYCIHMANEICREIDPGFTIEKGSPLDGLRKAVLLLIPGLHFVYLYSYIKDSNTIIFSMVDSTFKM